MNEKKKLNYQLVAIDLDWTTIRSDKTIGEETICAVNEALDMGCEVIFCTGRSRVQFERYLAHFPKMRYAIASSGAVVYDVATWEKLVSNEIPPELMEKILVVAQRVDCFPFLAVEGKSVYPGPMAPMAEEYGLREYIYEMTNFATGAEDIFAWYRNAPCPVESVAMYFRDDSPCVGVGEALGKLPLSLSFPEEPGVEVSLNTADKGKALTGLCARLGIPMEQTMVIGDSDNDLPMFRAAGLAVAVANATPKAKKLAHDITFDCDHDGVGAAIRKYVLNL